MNDELKTSIIKIVNDSLIDEQLEVRLSASITLTGFIHSKFIDVDDKLIVILSFMIRFFDKIFYVLKL